MIRMMMVIMDDVFTTMMMVLIDIFTGFGRLTPQLSVASYSNNEEGQVIIFYLPVFCLKEFDQNIPELVPI